MILIINLSKSKRKFNIKFSNKSKETYKFTFFHIIVIKSYFHNILLLIKMIKRDVLHRADIKTVYSSERQERMKVYFELTDDYNNCIEPCKLQPFDIK